MAELANPLVVSTMKNYYLFLFLLLFGTDLNAQDFRGLFDVINDEDSVHIEISTNFKTFLKKKDDYQEASMKITADGSTVILDTIIEIRTRGNSRKSICYMPPSKIRISKDYLAARGLKTYPTLKIVNSCSFNNLAEEYVMNELLLYKMYFALTDRCYRTKKVSLTYTDSEGKKKPAEFDGFIIEHEDQLADRLNGEIYDAEFANTRIFDHESYLLFTMFQYMIGNTDWKVLNRHNMAIVKVEADRTCYPIAYDFDYSGIINASYAVPNEKVPIKAVTERFYLGPCQTEDEVKKMCALFLDKKDVIYQLVAQADLDERRKNQCQGYLEDFYTELENEKLAQRIFTNCIDY